MFEPPALVDPDPLASGCRTPCGWLRNDVTKMIPRKQEPRMRSKTNRRLGPGATGMLCGDRLELIVHQFGPQQGMASRRFAGCEHSIARHRS